MIVAPSTPWHGWRGGLLISGGLMMLVQPPRVQIPRLWLGLAVAFMLLTSLVFLPAGWFPVPAWRALLADNGMTLAGSVTAHPLQTIECLAALAVCLAGALFLTGHRVDHGANHLLALLFSAGVAFVALLAITVQEYRWVIPWDPETSFGFFANRNHTATLLVMGSIAGLGVAVQSLRVRTWGSGLVALASVFVSVWALIRYSESRAGIILLAGAFAAWVLLLGRNYVRGPVLVATALLAGAALLYYSTTDTGVKKRLGETADRLAALAGTTPAGELSPRSHGTGGSFQSLDLRVPLYLDTWEMLRQAPWTGVGIGQFEYVFPQYRHRSAVANHSQAVHPESDWLLMAAESGIPATLALAALVIAAGGSALLDALRGRARALRTGCLVAAAVVPLHGLFDVPGHRIELVWPACWLLAITLRGTSNTPLSSKGSRFTFQGLGIAVIAAGVLLIHSQWFGGRTPAMLVSPQTVQKVTALHAEDLAEQTAAAAGDPVATAGEDRLETALVLLDQALKVTPMDAHLHYLRGVIALHFDDKDAEVDRAFALQRLLDPTWVALPLIQATAWSAVDPARGEPLWSDALHRAEALEKIDPATPYGRKETLARIVEAKGKLKN